LRALIISDVVNPKLYSSYLTQIAGNVDIIISCGDLPIYYLDYIVSSLDKPLFYIHGNHDNFNDSLKKNDFSINKQTFNDNKMNYTNGANFGGKNIENKIINYNGLIFGGLGGSLLYNKGLNKYTETQMFYRILKLFPLLLFNKITNGRYIDVLITHVPPRGIHDKEDLPHRGFKSFITFIKIFKPKYLLHGHIHIYDNNENRISEYYGTKIINCYDHQIIDLKILNSY